MDLKGWKRMKLLEDDKKFKIFDQQDKLNNTNGKQD